jgi:transposase
VEKIHWLLIMQLSQGQAETIAQAAGRCGLDHSWACRVVKRYNELGPEGLKDRRKGNGSQGLLSPEDKSELIKAMKGEAPDGGLWTSPKVALWIGKRLGRIVRAGSAWSILRQLGLRTKVPRPRHQKGAGQAEQAAFKKSSAKTLRGSVPSTPGKKSSFGPKTKPG